MTPIILGPTLLPYFLFVLMCMLVVRFRQVQSLTQLAGTPGLQWAHAAASTHQRHGRPRPPTYGRIPNPQLANHPTHKLPLPRRLSPARNMFVGLNYFMLANAKGALQAAAEAKAAQATSNAKKRSGPKPKQQVIDSGSGLNLNLSDLSHQVFEHLEFSDTVELLVGAWCSRLGAACMKVFLDYSCGGPGGGRRAPAPRGGRRTPAPRGGRRAPAPPPPESRVGPTRRGAGFKFGYLSGCDPPSNPHGHTPLPTAHPSPSLTLHPSTPPCLTPTPTHPSTPAP